MIIARGQVLRLGTRRGRRPSSLPRSGGTGGGRTGGGMYWSTPTNPSKSVVKDPVTARSMPVWQAGQRWEPAMVWVMQLPHSTECRHGHDRVWTASTPQPLQTRGGSA